MTQLTTLMFVAAIVLWGLASIPDGSGDDKASPAYRRVELAKRPIRPRRRCEESNFDVSLGER